MAKETMKKAVEMLDQEGLSLVELLTMDTLLLGQDDAELKEAVGEMDLVLSGSAELYEAAEIQEARCLQRPSERPFIQMFLKYLQKSKKRVYLLTESEPEKEPLDARRLLQNVVLPATAGILFVIMTVLLLKVVRGGRRKK